MIAPIPNEWESDYERDVLWPLFIAGEVLAYYYEGISIRLADGAWYTPDWFVVFNDRFECHEVKGFWRAAARVRIKVAAGLHTHWRFVAVTRKRKGAEWEREIIGRAANV